MKINDFKANLKSEIEAICEENGWKYDNNKQRGMAFEDWCFSLLSERYPAAENDRSSSIIRGDDFTIDVVFESRDTEEVYILQCKNEKIAASDPLNEEDVRTFFQTASLLADNDYMQSRKTGNQRIKELAKEFQAWKKDNYAITFIFVSTGRATEKTEALLKKYNSDHSDTRISFKIWDIDALKEEYVSVKSIEEHYPEDVSLVLADGHYLCLRGDPKNITFAIRGTSLQQVFRQHKDRLFNWNIRRFLGKKGQVNSGMTTTLDKEPGFFYYFNNGISALCDSFDFNEQSKKLRISRFQIVNGAQTMGALGAADEVKAQQAFVLVKLTALKNAHRETGLAASLIKSNNTQNTLRVPDFRTNDKIQLWLEQKFKDTKPKGSLAKIIYGRKRPYTRALQGSLLLKMQDFGKIRYAWIESDPRIPIAEPSRLFELKEDGGLYDDTFGVSGNSVDMYNEEQFKESLLAVHSFYKILDLLKHLEEEGECKQLSRLKYYGLHLLKMYADRKEAEGQVTRDELFLFGAKYDEFFKKASVVLQIALEGAYKEILDNQKGTAFSLPRDPKVWEVVKKRFADALKMEESFAAVAQR